MAIYVSECIPVIKRCMIVVKYGNIKKKKKAGIAWRISGKSPCGRDSFQSKILKKERWRVTNSVQKNKHENIIQPFEKLAWWSINDLSSL